MKPRETPGSDQDKLLFFRIKGAKNGPIFGLIGVFLVSKDPG